jgi:hypothetical protein
MPTYRKTCNFCEVPYSDFVKRDPLPKILQGKIRADLVVITEKPAPKFVIRVEAVSNGQSERSAFS